MRINDLLPGRRTVLAVLIAATSALGAPVSAGAQAPTGPNRFTARTLVGAFIPTGDQRDFLKDSPLLGAQASWNATVNFAITTTVGWAPSKDKLTGPENKIDAFQFDIGVEARSARSDAALVSPFFGVGGGVRTYSYRDLDIDSRSNVAGYGALGVDVRVGVFDTRVEGRNYKSRFKPFAFDAGTKTQNDVGVFAGLGLRF